MKKQIILLGLFLALYNVLLADVSHVKHIISLTQTYVDGSKMNIQPGDTICIEAGERTSLKFINFNGSASNYIVFKNFGGEVIVKNDYMPYGISIENSSFFRFTGTGSSDIKYGIRILGTKSGASGLGVGNLSTNFEIDHLEIANTGFAGIFSKTDPVCDLSKNRGNFTQYQSFYHDNYIHNTGGEGMYIGYSFYSGKSITCDGVPTMLYPCDLIGVRIYNNVIDSAGWDGIQVGCATEDCEVYNNAVTNYGVAGVPAQHTGIQIGGGTTGLCYNNKIVNGSGPGIAVFGLGNNDIFNNLIVNAGYNYFPNDSTKRIYGIFCDDRDPIPGRYFNFYNNTIVNPKTDGIRFMSVLSKNNLLYNNIIIHPGSLLSYNFIPAQSPYINLSTNVDAVLANNYFYKDASNIQFVDSLNTDYRLSANSPAIDAGFDMSNKGLNFDINNAPRPSGNGYDIGAFERPADLPYSKHIITLSQSYIDGSKMSIQPGDTICIEAGQRTSLKFINFNGSANNYIVFKNLGGEVIVKNDYMPYGISIENSSYFRFTGTGSSEIKYGIRVLGTKSGASGFSAGNLSSNFEIDHIEIANTGYAGIFSKTDPNCDLTKNRGYFTQYQSIYHDNYIHNTGGEGMLIGYSSYNGNRVTCDGISTILYPGDLKGVRVYNNQVDSTGREGIQVGCATEDCEIYNNTITNYGVSDKNAGIQIGGGTTGMCYNNKILNGSGDGIEVFGLGNNDVFNNLIVNAGYNYYPNDSTKSAHGIYCDDRGEPIPERSFNFYNNTIVNPKTDGIRLASTLTNNNIIYNNIIINPGSLLSYSKFPKQSPYINIGNRIGIDAVLANNYLDKNASTILFVDNLNGDYRLSESSPAIDSGLDLSSIGYTFDMDNMPRPSGSSYDIGAYENQSGVSSRSFVKSSTKQNSSTEKQNPLSSEHFEGNSIQNNGLSIYPNPNKGNFSIQKNDRNSILNLNVLDSKGQVVYTQSNLTESITYFNLNLAKGLYLVILGNENGKITQKLIVK